MNTVNKTYIFGSGSVAEKAFQYFGGEVLAVVDNNTAKHGSLFRGLPIISPLEIGKQHPRIVIASSFFYEIYTQLNKLELVDPRIQIAKVDEILTIEETKTLIEQHKIHTDWIESFKNTYLSSPSCFIADRETYLERALNEAKNQGLVLEFGVFQGESIKILEKHAQQNIYGFDSFEGLAQDWGLYHKKGTFNVEGSLPQVNKDTHLIKGYFEDTLEEFLIKNSAPIRLLHCDADLFESTNFVLDKLSHLIQAGSILIFDDFLYELDYERCDYRALKNLVAKRNLSIEYLTFTTDGSVTIRVVNH